jgi:hypothetical protein
MLRSRADLDAQLVKGMEGVLGPYLESGRVGLTASGNTLVIACRDHTSATDLRFLQRDIRKTLMASGNTDITQVRVIVAPPTADPPWTTERGVQRAIPPTARKALYSAAAVIDDSGLANALRRLARLGGGDDPNR